MKQIFIVCIASILLACASPEKEPSSADFEPSTRTSDCILEGTIRDYRVLDESNLVVTASGRLNDHIELTRRNTRIY